MQIRNFAHKGLKRLYSEESAKGVPPDTVDKLRKMFAYLDNMEDPEELRKTCGVEGSRVDNGELLKAAEEAGFEVLLTTDKNMVAQQNTRFSLTVTLLLT